MDRKKRILWCSEASFLHSGFSTLSLDILHKLYKTGKYEIFELGSYAQSDDPRQLELPWKFYGAIPPKENDYAYKHYHSTQTGQFGESVFEQVCLDCKCDVVVSVLDHWMQRHQLKSPLRPNYKLMWMPTIDGEPQRLEWLDDYSQVDSILTYSRYGKETLEKEAPNKIRVFDIAAPGVDHELFVPMDRAKLRETYGIDQHAQILMTVMRNQKRKLFPDLIEMFAGYLKYCKSLGNKYLEQNSYLFMHTSYPDVGYDLGKYIMEFGVGHRCLFSYYCRNCRKTAVDFFQGELAVCKYCNQKTAAMPNTSIGVSREELARLYNISDAYIQYAICEGFGMGIAEAKSCGISSLAVDYSAMAEQVNIEGCQPIKVGKFFYESCMETEQKRALPDNADCIKKVYDYFILPRETRERFSQLCRNDVLQNYTFDRCAKIFEKAIDSLKVPEHSETWLNPKGKFAPLSVNFPQNKSNLEFIEWCIVEILGKPELKNTYWKTELVKGLNVGYMVERGGRTGFDKKACIGMFQQIARLHNYWEGARISLLQPENPNKISWKLI